MTRATFKSAAPSNLGMPESSYITPDVKQGKTDEPNIHVSWSAIQASTARYYQEETCASAGAKRKTGHLQAALSSKWH